MATDKQSMVVGLLLDLALSVSWWAVKTTATGVYYSAEAAYSWATGAPESETSPEPTDLLEAACFATVPADERREWLYRCLFDHNRKVLAGVSEQFLNGFKKASCSLVFMDRCGGHLLAETPLISDALTVGDVRRILAAIETFQPRLEQFPWCVITRGAPFTHYAEVDAETHLYQLEDEDCVTLYASESGDGRRVVQLLVELNGQGQRKTRC